MDEMVGVKLYGGVNRHNIAGIRQQPARDSNSSTNLDGPHVKGNHYSPVNGFIGQFAGNPVPLRSLRRFGKHALVIESQGS